MLFSVRLLIFDFQYYTNIAVSPLIRKFKVQQNEDSH